MRQQLVYWSVLVLKAVAAFVVLGGAWYLGIRFLSGRFPLQGIPALLAWSGSIFGFLLCAFVSVYLSVADHRYRCRVCLRRLRMPVSDGSFGALLLDRPGVEYICPFGHGKLRVPEGQLASHDVDNWTEYADFWQELYEPSSNHPA